MLLVFLGLGMLVGEDGPGGIPFNDFRTAYLVGSVALAVILFDGGLRTRLAAMRGAALPAGLLATVGVIVTGGVTGLVPWLLLDLTPVESLLLGAIVASTDAAAVFFLLRAGGLELRRRVNSVIEIESGTNDPFAVFLVVLLVELLEAPQAAGAWTIARALLSEAALGAILGVIGGFLACAVLRRVTLPSGLHPLLVTGMVIMVFALSNLLGGSGFLAAYLAGLVVGNRPVPAAAAIASFHDTATWFCQIVMFLVLGLLVTPSQLLDYAVPGLLRPPS